MMAIFNIHLRKLAKLVETKGIKLTVSEGAKKQIAEQGFSPEFGARPLIGTIRSELTRPISKMIIKEELVAGNELTVGLKG